MRKLDLRGGVSATDWVTGSDTSTRFKVDGGTWYYMCWVDKDVTVDGYKFGMLVMWPECVPVVTETDSREELIAALDRIGLGNLGVIHE